jgi:hypothetical protein
LFCDEFCRLWAEDVRYFRGVYAEGRHLRDPLVAEALNTRMAQLLSGGYPAKDRRLPQAAREAVLGRNNGLCISCNNQPATEVDHIDGSSPDPANRQGLCHPCHQKKTESRYVPMEESHHRAMRDAFLAYVHEPEPVMLAHDRSWKDRHRKLKKETLDWALSICAITIELPLPARRRAIQGH